MTPTDAAVNDDVAATFPADDSAAAANNAAAATLPADA